MTVLFTNGCGLQRERFCLAILCFAALYTLHMHSYFMFSPFSLHHCCLMFFPIFVSSVFCDFFLPACSTQLHPLHLQCLWPAHERQVELAHQAVLGKERGSLKLYFIDANQEAAKVLADVIGHLGTSF